MRETCLIPLNDTAEDGEKFIIYRPRLKLAFIGNQAMADLARRGAGGAPPPDDQEEATRFLKQVGFFLPDVEVRHPADGFTSAVLLLTNRCQLRCVYCYAAAGALAEKVLDVLTAKAVIRYVYEQAAARGRTSFNLEFHGGGEPTLEWEVLQQAVAYARALPLPARISVTTNAIWSETQAEWLIENLDGISISMDGAATTQDRNRPLASGKASAGLVSASLQRLDAHNYAYGIRMTATQPWEELAENIRYIAQATRCRRVQVEPAFQPGRGRHGAPEEQDVWGFIDAFADAWAVAREYQVDLRYAGARPGSLTRHFCSAPYDALVVNPQDQIVACYEVVNPRHALGELSLLGEVRDGAVTLFPGRREHLHNLMTERFEACGTCFCRWTCAGDCYVRTFQPGEQGHLAYGERCEINRELTTFLLLQRIAEGGGVWQGFHARPDPRDSRYG